MPKQINTWTFGHELVKKFGLKGRFQPVLDEVIVPVTVVDSTKDERPAAGGYLAAASGAGNQNRIFFSNPANSGVLVTLKQWWAASGAPTTDYIQIILSTASPTNAGFRAWRDRELAGVPIGGFSATTAAAAVLGAPQYHLDGDNRVWEADWILHPNTKIEFRQNAQNQTLSLGINWTETNITVTDSP